MESVKSHWPSRMGAHFAAVWWLDLIRRVLWKKRTFFSMKERREFESALSKRVSNYSVNFSNWHLMS